MLWLDGSLCLCGRCPRHDVPERILIPFHCISKVVKATSMANVWLKKNVYAYIYCGHSSAAFSGAPLNGDNPTPSGRVTNWNTINSNGCRNSVLTGFHGDDVRDRTIQVTGDRFRGKIQICFHSTLVMMIMMMNE